MDAWKRFGAEGKLPQPAGAAGGAAAGAAAAGAAGAGIGAAAGAAGRATDAKPAALATEAGCVRAARKLCSDHHVLLIANSDTTFLTTFPISATSFHKGSMFMAWNLLG